MKKAILVLFFIAALSVNTHAENFNPNGYCGHSSISFYSSWIYRESVYFTQYDELMDNFSFTETDIQKSFAAAFNLNIPFSRRATFTGGYNIQDVHGIYLHTYHAGVIIFSTEVNQLSDLKNPDGMIKSFIISPVLGLNASYGKSPKTGLVAGLQLSYVATKNFTLNSAYLLSRFESSNSHTILMGITTHVNNKVPSDHAFNPDGRPGSISFSPNIGYVTMDGDIHGFTAGVELTVPVCTWMSTYLTFQYEQVKEDQKEYYFFRNLQKSTLLNPGLGLNIYF